MATIPEALAIATEHHRAGRLQPAEEIYRQILQVDPGQSDAWHLLGFLAHQTGRHDAAAEYVGTAIRMRGDQPAYHHNLGDIYRVLGRSADAMSSYRRALEIQPDLVESLNNLALVLLNEGRTHEAVACCRRATEARPADAELHRNLGVALQRLENWDEAAACHRRALDLRPDYIDSHYNLGIVHAQRGNYQDAIACFRRVMELKPDHADACSRLGVALYEHNQLEEAVARYRQALALQPDHAEAFYNLGLALRRQGKVEEAIACHHRALEIKPDCGDFHNALLCALNYRPGITLAELAEAHADFDRRHALPPPTDWPALEANGDSPRRLRLGFLSTDFCEHPVGFFLIRALENIDRRDVEIVCYSDRNIEDSLKDRFRATATLWRDTLGWTHERLAEQIREDRIHILFDLAGHTGGSRMLTFVRKPAPVQISWIGYEGTTGLSAMDYLLVDRFMVPEAAEAHYRETVVRLPDCYVSYDPPKEAPPVSSLPALRSGFVTFGSCNNLAKINADVVATWAEILHRVPGAKLLLKYRGLEDDEVRRRFLSLFAARGIPAERLLLEGWTPLGELMARHADIDVALDPFPFAGGVTTCNSLWMGVPVVTWPGETFAGRHSLSYLSAIGLTETIADSREAYVDIATGLAADLPRLAAIRSGLRDRMAASPLCDGRRVAENLVHLLHDVWQHRHTPR